MPAGSFALISGSGQALPSTTFGAIDIGSIDVDVDTILSESAGVFTPQEEGYYLIEVRGIHDSTHNHRQNIQWSLQVNSADVVGGRGSGYSRNNSNSILAVRCVILRHFNGTTDSFNVQHRRDAGGGSPAGTYVDTYAQVVLIATGAASATPYARYTTPAGASLGGQGFSTVTGWDVDVETDTGVIQIQAGVGARLKEANRPYLFVYGLENDDSGGARTTRVAKAFHNSTAIHHSVSSVYQRNAADQYANPVGFGIVRPGTANQDLDVRVAGYIDNLAVLWGTFTDGTWNLAAAANTAGFTVIALPVGANIAVYEDGTANQSITGTGLVDIASFRTTIGTQDSPFSRINNTDVDVTLATDILAIATFHDERTASSGTRWTGGGRIEIETVTQARTRYVNYDRGEQSGSDTKNAVCNVMFVGAVAANDTIQLQKYSPDVNNGGNNFTSDAGGAFLDLASLAGGVAYVETPVDSIDVTDSITSTKTIPQEIAENVGTADSTTTAKSATQAVTDDADVTDLVTTIKTSIRTVSEPVGVTDTTTASSGMAREISEALGVTDVVSDSETNRETITETAGITDLVVTSLRAPTRAISEPVGITDEALDVLTTSALTGWGVPIGV